MLKSTQTYFCELLVSQLSPTLSTFVGYVYHTTNNYFRL